MCSDRSHFQSDPAVQVFEDVNLRKGICYVTIIVRLALHNAAEQQAAYNITRSSAF